MAPGKLLMFHAPLLPLAAHELLVLPQLKFHREYNGSNCDLVALWVHVAHTDILCSDMHCNIGRIFWHVNSDFP